MKFRLSFMAALIVATLPLRAHAQVWTSDTRYAEGIGIRAGNLELHPSLGGEFGYDSNFFQRSGNTNGGQSPQEEVIDIWRLRITPSFSVSSLSGARAAGSPPPTLHFSAAAHLAYNQIIAVDSENDEANGARFGIGADMKLALFPKRPVGIDLFAAYVRAFEPTNDPDEDRDWTRDTVRAGGDLIWRPGGGLFEWSAGYNVMFNWFEAQPFQLYNNVQNQIRTRGRWRFLPRTALLYEGSYTFLSYTNPTSQNDGDSINSRIGIRGLVTNRLALLGLVGWAASFYENTDVNGQVFQARQYDSVVGQAEARWFLQSAPSEESLTAPVGLSSIALGYTRQFSNSYYGSFYQRDRGYGQFGLFLGGAVVGSLEAGVSRIAYPEVTLSTQQVESFSQLRFDARLFAEYRFIDTVGVNTTLRYDLCDSPAVPVSSTPGGVQQTDDLSFTRWQAYIGLRWFM
jgi:hypothetical protein